MLQSLPNPRLRKGKALSVAALVAVLTLGGALSAQAAPDAGANQAVASGREIFKAKCHVCHDASKASAVRAGPPLYGVVGRKAAAVNGFIYTQPMKIAADDGLAWDEATLNAYLANPQALIPGTAMVKELALPRPEDRTAMIAYLKSLK